jgi:hypothetical protein
MTAERGHPPSRPPAGPPPAHGGPRRVPPAGEDARWPVPADGERAVRGSRPPGGARATSRRAPSPVAAGIEPVASRGPRRLAKPKAVRVKADDTGRPLRIEKREVDAVRESWLVEDRWWTDAPLRRRYWEVVTGDGRDLVVFRDLIEGRWYAQR